MKRYRDSAWQYITTTIISLVSLSFTPLFFQGDLSLRLLGAIIVVVFIVGIILVNVWPMASKSPTGTSTPTIFQPQYQPTPYAPIPQPPQGFPMPPRRQYGITPTKFWVFLFFLIGFLLLIGAIASGVITGAAYDSAWMNIIGMIDFMALLCLFGAWVFALVNTAQLGYWGWFALVLLPFFGILIYVFLVPIVPRKLFSPPYNQPYP